MIPPGYIFRPRYERAYFVILAISLSIVVAKLFGLIQLPSLQVNWVKLAVYFLFFNYLHTVLTFVGLALLPELRSWLKTQFRPRRLVVPAIVVAGILYASVQFRTLNPDDLSDLFLLSIFSLLISIHNLGQTKGLSLMYNRSIYPRLTDAEKAQQRKVENTERRLFNVLLLFQGGVAVQTVFFKDLLSPDMIIFFFEIFGLVTLALVLNAVRYPGVLRTNKLIFLQGVWFFALRALAPVIMIFQMALHGLEYVFLGDVALQRTRVKMGFKWIALGISLLILGTVLKAFDPRVFDSNWKYVNHSFLRVMAAISILFEFLHYYIDSILFKFNDPVVRENVSPLFSTKGNAS